jgi:hypothetical protein
LGIDALGEFHQAIVAYAAAEHGNQQQERYDPDATQSILFHTWRNVAAV